MTCEEAEEEALKETEERESEVNVQPSEGTSKQSEPSRTRERCRQAARRLAARGEILITQEGQVVDPNFARGVMELKLPS